MRKKAQVSPDYLVAVIFLGIIAIVAFSVLGDNNASAFSSIERLNAAEITRLLADAISDVWILGEGGEKTLSLAPTLEGGEQYNLTVSENLVLLAWGPSDHASRFPKAVLNQSLTRLDGGDILITYSNGSIRLQNIR